jgi:hypothetical protein
MISFENAQNRVALSDSGQRESDAMQANAENAPISRCVETVRAEGYGKTGKQLNGGG